MQTLRQIQVASLRIAPHSAPYLLCVIVGAYLSLSGLGAGVYGI